MNSSPSLIVVIRNKDNILYNGPAFGITSINDKGTFDVLPGHESFITLIREKVIIHPTPKTSQEILIDNGIARVHEDKMHIFVNFKS